jgi:hypothetical protein
VKNFGKHINELCLYPKHNGELLKPLKQMTVSLTHGKIKNMP